MNMAAASAQGIDATIHGVAEVAVDSAAGAERARSAAAELARLGVELEELVSRFQLPV